MTDLSDLFERVRKAEGPDRTIDLLILALVAQAGEWGTVDIEYALRDIEGTTAPPHFTAAIDAITALIEKKLPGCMKRVFDNPDDGSVRAQIVAISGPAATADHDTWPLALCLALLLSLQESSK
ncbi:hypothetical protein JP75_07775 [Devosia riboflavina]|uniref:Uncharacterized protein n=1 Tax=Devosia riboflavina TaxID=46914 RepID=A0A087M3J1_9HYPH|nr:hypothetical protein [Devosia riboflavina]KFL31444.1 hypothetical protein JP75_07775 [Devosia riboflavina]